MNRIDIVAEHIDDAAQAIAQMHTEHHARATTAERVFAAATAAIASPRFIVATACVSAMWIAENALAPLWGWRAFDPPPFELLQGVATLAALYATVLILATQRREDEIATQREQLALQLALLSDRKLAKVIGLIEELRRDDPSMRNRVDHEADAMTRPADPRAVLDALGNE